MKPIRDILITGRTVFLLSVLAGSLFAIADSSASPLFTAAFLSFDTGASPISVAIGDLNGDGNPDLAVANGAANTVSVLLGNGDGTFGTKTDFGTGGVPSSVAIGDLDGDGKLDLAVANGSSTVSVLPRERRRDVWGQYRLWDGSLPQLRCDRGSGRGREARPRGGELLQHRVGAARERRRYISSQD